MTKKSLINSKKISMLVLAVLSWSLFACTLNPSAVTSVADPAGKDAPVDYPNKKIILKISDDPINLEINEGSAILLIVNQSVSRDKDTPIDLIVSSMQEDISAVFPDLISTQPKQAKKNFKVTSKQMISNLTLNTTYNQSYTGDKLFILNFSTSDSEVVNQLPEITLKIKDLEAPPEINFSAASLNMSESAAAQTATVTLSKASSASITVAYSITAGTASLNTDFIASPGNITFAPGETTKTISYSVVDDNQVESGPAEYLTISLGGITGTANMGTQNSLQVNIVDNDTENLSIAPAFANEGGNIVFNVNLSNSSSNSVSVNYATVDNSAVAGVHYITKSGTLTFSPGDTTKSISIATIANNTEICASDRSFNLVLSGAVGASIAVASASGTIVDPDIPTVSITNASANEGTAVNFTATLSAICPTKNVSFNYASSAVSAVSGGDYVAVNSSASIAAGVSAVTISINTLDDSIYEGDETFTISLSSPANATLSGAIATGSILDDEVQQGVFSITGITGATDSTIDGYLVNGVQATVNWQSSANSTNYDVTVYENDGVTVKCPTTNTTNTSFDFGSLNCDLIAGNNYKAQVIAKVGSQTLEATNNLYHFYVNQSPILGTGGNGSWYVLAGSSITIDAQWAASPAVGVATDAEGESLSFSTTGSPSLGSIVNSGSSITYSANASSFGVESFSFSIVDTKGGVLNQTMTIHVVTAYTWIGASSNNWSVASNWCGTISANKRSCAGSASTPGTGNIAIIDNTCSSLYCSPIINANTSIGGLKIAGNSLTQGTGYTLTIGTSHLAMSAGSFTGANANVTINGDFTLTGGIFTAPTASLLLSRNITFGASAVFNHNNGTVDFNRQYATANTISFSVPIDFHNLSLRGAGSTNTISGTAKVNGTLTTNSAVGTPTYNGGTIEVYGDAVLNNGNLTGTSVLRWKGSNNQSITGVGITSSSESTYTEIDKSGGVLTLINSIPIKYFTYITGDVNAGTSLVYWQVPYASTYSYNFGNIQFYDLTIKAHGSTANLLSDIYVNRNLTFITATGRSRFNSNKIYALGNISLGPSAGLDNRSSTVLSISGSSDQTIFSDTSSALPDLEFNSSGGTVTISGTPTFSDFIYNSGNVLISSASVIFDRSNANSYLLSPGPVQFNDVTIKSSSTTTTLSGTLQVLGSLTVVGGVGAATFNGGVIQVNGNFSNGGFSGTAQMSFVGANASIISSTSSTIPTGLWTVNKSGGSLTLASNISINSSGQSMVVSAGDINMAGYNLTINNSLNLISGTSITKNAGVLTVGGSAISSGAYSGGTINP